MVAIGMNLMPQKVIRKKIYLRVKSLFGLSKDSRLKRRLNTWKKEKSKEMNDFMKVEEGSVHRKRNAGHCMKQ
jgi:hypothetical protein